MTTKELKKIFESDEIKKETEFKGLITLTTMERKSGTKYEKLTMSNILKWLVVRTWEDADVSFGNY